MTEDDGEPKTRVLCVEALREQLEQLEREEHTRTVPGRASTTPRNACTRPSFSRSTVRTGVTEILSYELEGEAPQRGVRGIILIASVLLGALAGALCVALVASDPAPPPLQPAPDTAENAPFEAVLVLQVVSGEKRPLADVGVHVDGTRVAQTDERGLARATVLGRGKAQVRLSIECPPGSSAPAPHELTLERGATSPLLLGLTCRSEAMQAGVLAPAPPPPSRRVRNSHDAGAGREDGILLSR